MFIGHTAIALAAKKAAPQVRFGTLLFAALFADLLFPILILLGVEHVMPSPGITAMTPYDFYDYPHSHSLLTNAAFALYLCGNIFSQVSRVERRVGSRRCRTQPLGAGFYFSPSRYAAGYRVHRC